MGLSYKREHKYSLHYRLENLPERYFQQLSIVICTIMQCRIYFNRDKLFANVGLEFTLLF